MLLSHLNDIIESTLLAKINVIPKLILDKTEITKIKQIFKTQNYTIKSEQHIYNLLKMNTLNYQDKIIFSIKIPIFLSFNYEMARLIPLPINSTQFVIAPKYLIYNNKSNSMFSTMYKCPVIEEQFVCEIDSINNFKNNTCLGHLIQIRPATAT